MLDSGGNASLLIPRGDDNREQRERSGWLVLRQVGHSLCSPFPNREACGTGQVGFDKKMKSAEHFVITMLWAGKERPAAVICVEWIQSAGHGEQEPYGEKTPSQQ
jgi:hypothetical protein